MALDTNLLGQILLSVGSGLNQQPWNKNLSQLGLNTLQSKKSGDLNQLFAKILSGELQGASAKIDGEKANFTFPSGMFGEKSTDKNSLTEFDASLGNASGGNNPASSPAGEGSFRLDSIIKDSLSKALLNP
jgi:hypothetical protein